MKLSLKYIFYSPHKYIPQAHAVTFPLDFFVAILQQSRGKFELIEVYGVIHDLFDPDRISYINFYLIQTRHTLLNEFYDLDFYTRRTKFKYQSGHFNFFQEKTVRSFTPRRRTTF